jgi:hypothetical protein
VIDASGAYGADKGAANDTVVIVSDEDLLSQPAPSAAVIKAMVHNKEFLGDQSPRNVKQNL